MSSLPAEHRDNPLAGFGAAAFRESSSRTAVVFAIIAAGLLAYANTFTGEFVWDDASSILLHETVQNPSRFFELFREDQHAYGRGQGNFYRPLVAASFMLDYALATGDGGGDPHPFVFHVTSVAWHVAAALLFFALLTRLRAPLFVRAAAPLLYVLHPLHTEAVAYISGRADSMAAALMFAGLVFATWDETTRRRAIGGALTALCFVAALLSKESALIFPVLLAVCGAYRSRALLVGEKSGVRRHWLVLLGVSVVILGVYIALRSTVLQFAAPEANAAAPLGQRLAETLQAFALYAGLIVAPNELHMERTLVGVGGWATFAGLVLIAACVIAAVVAYRRRYYRIGVGLAWFVATWLPISGLFPLNAPMAEHWLYVPLAGLLWAFMEVVALLPRPAMNVAAVALAVWGFFLLGATVNRNLDWRSNEALFRATLQENPDSLRVRYNLAVTYEDILDNPTGAAREYEALIARYEQAASQNSVVARGYAPTALEAQLSLGQLLLERRDAAGARDAYVGALQLAADWGLDGYLGQAAFGLGQAYLGLGEHEAAIREFERAVRVQPELAPAVQRLIGVPRTV